MKNDYFFLENRDRTQAYHKDEAQQALFKEMNEALSKITVDQSVSQSFPTLFIFGLPRSGTTLLYQLLAQTLDIGYVNNLIARFWLAPIVGIELSKSVLKEKMNGSFESRLGQTDEPDGPHEFSYFWQRWLEIHCIDDMLIFNEPNLKIDWEGLKRQITAMQAAFGSGIIFKTMYAANHLRSFSNLFSLPLFIYVDRDPYDVALSILSARKTYYGNIERWWATCPPNYYDLESLPFAEQIAGQVVGLRQTYENLLNEIDGQLILRIKYSDLCNNPKGIVEAVSQKMQSVHGFELNIRVKPPLSFVKSTKKIVNAEEKAVVDALNKMRNTF